MGPVMMWNCHQGLTSIARTQGAAIATLLGPLASQYLWRAAARKDQHPGKHRAPGWAERTSGYFSGNEKRCADGPSSGRLRHHGYQHIIRRSRSRSKAEVRSSAPLAPRLHFPLLSLGVIGMQTSTFSATQFTFGGTSVRSGTWMGSTTPSTAAILRSASSSCPPPPKR